MRTAFYGSNGKIIRFRAACREYYISARTVQRMYDCFSCICQFIKNLVDSSEREDALKYSFSDISPKTFKVSVNGFVVAQLSK